MDTRIVLISMVKNESKILERCLKSVEEVCDAFVFLDTGSTDSTVDVINTFYALIPILRLRVLI